MKTINEIKIKHAAELATFDAQNAKVKANYQSLKLQIAEMEAKMAPGSSNEDYEKLNRKLVKAIDAMTEVSSIRRQIIRRHLVELIAANM